MRTLATAAIAAFTVTATQAQEAEHRELGAHEHGVGQLDMAFEGDRIAIELHAPPTSWGSSTRRGARGIAPRWTGRSPSEVARFV